MLGINVIGLFVYDVPIRLILIGSVLLINVFMQVLSSIGNFCICSIAIGIVIEIIVKFPFHKKIYWKGVNNLLVLLIGGIPIAMPTVLSVTMAIGSHRLSQQVIS